MASEARGGNPLWPNPHIAQGSERKEGRRNVHPESYNREFHHNPANVEPRSTRKSQSGSDIEQHLERRYEGRRNVNLESDNREFQDIPANVEPPPRMTSESGSDPRWRKSIFDNFSFPSFFKVVASGPYRNPQGQPTYLQLKEQVDSLSRTIEDHKSQNVQLIQDNKRLEDEKREVDKNLSNLELKYGQKSQTGSYSENSASPAKVSAANRDLSLAVASFSNRLIDLMPSLRTTSEMYGPNLKFLRSSHFPAEILKAKVTNLLFENFENESFSEGGRSEYLDPVQRKREFFTSFLAFRDGDLEDENRFFDQYHQRCKTRLWNMYSIEVSDEELRDMEEKFKNAAQKVWILHLLCFSFARPASIFRIGSDAEFDKTFMETPLFLEVDEDEVAKVAFMMAPGFRVDKITIKSQIYPVVKEVDEIGASHNAPDDVFDEDVEGGAPRMNP